MFLRIAGAHRAEQSGIKGVKIPFDPNIRISSLDKCIKSQHTILSLSLKRRNL